MFLFVLTSLSHTLHSLWHTHKLRVLLTHRFHLSRWCMLDQHPYIYHHKLPWVEVVIILSNPRVKLIVIVREKTLYRWNGGLSEACAIVSVKQVHAPDHVAIEAKLLKRFQECSMSYFFLAIDLLPATCWCQTHLNLFFPNELLRCCMWAGRCIFFQHRSVGDFLQVTSLMQQTLCHHHWLVNFLTVLVF